MVIIDKHRYYYYARGESAYILSVITGIPIKENRCSFSQEHIKLIINALEKFCIQYVINDYDRTIKGTRERDLRELLEIGKCAYNVQRQIKAENVRIRNKLKNINQLKEENNEILST